MIPAWAMILVMAAREAIAVTAQVSLAAMGRYYAGDVGVGDACKGVPRGERTWRVSSSLSFLFRG
jgi:hypothetical protein